MEDQSSRGYGKRWILSSKVPLRQLGEITGLVGISRDITVLKQAEEDRERYFTLSSDLLCVAGSDGYFKSVNPAFERTLGFTPEELYAAPFVDFVHPDDRAATMAVVARMMTRRSRSQAATPTVMMAIWNAVPVPEEGDDLRVGA